MLRNINHVRNISSFKLKPKNATLSFGLQVSKMKYLGLNFNKFQNQSNCVYTADIIQIIKSILKWTYISYMLRKTNHVRNISSFKLKPKTLLFRIAFFMFFCFRNSVTK
jgi:hypothetical protein